MIKQIIILTVAFVALFIPTAHALQFFTKATQAIVYELNSDSVLFSHNADQKMVPSSMSKLMTLYLSFSYIKAGIVKMDDKYKVSKSAYARGGSSMYLREGQMVSVGDLINGIVTVSGNDACITLAEGISGSQERFVGEMNELAKELNLNDSHFSNVTGWPDQDHKMSARDILTLAKRFFVDFPEYYYLFSNREFSFNGISKENTNIKLLTSNLGFDGIKTGSTTEGGYGVISSAEINGRRIFIVVNGLKSDEERFFEVKRILNYVLHKFDYRIVIEKNKQIDEVEIWYGKEKKIPIAATENIAISYPKNSYSSVKVLLSYSNMIPAPVKKGDKVGELVIQIPDMEERIIPVYAMKNVKQLNYLERFYRMVFGLLSK